MRGVWPRTRNRLVAAIAASCFLAAPAEAHDQHIVAPGETLWSIAATNGLTPTALAAANGFPADSQLLAGEEIVLPTGGEDITVPPPETSGATAEAQGMVPIHHPSATPYLAPEAAAAWEAMRQESLRTLGIDLYPIGPLSGYRTYEQQAYFYELYLSGGGNPANPPGTSSHETGTAVDVATLEMRQAIDELGARYGWQKTEAPGEWWHVNYVGGYGE